MNENLLCLKSQDEEKVKSEVMEGPAVQTEEVTQEFFLYPLKTNISWDILTSTYICLSVCLSVYKILVSVKVLAGLLSHI